MKRYEILCLAQRSYDPGLNDVAESALSTVREVMRSACRDKQTEKDMRIALVRVLSAMRNSKLKDIGGCKQLEIRKAIEAVYGLSGDAIANPDLKNLTCEEILLYHMYFERLRKVKYVLPPPEETPLETAQSLENKDLSSDDMAALLSQTLKWKVTKRGKRR